MRKRDLDPTDPYLLEVIRAAAAFSNEREKRLHGQRASLEDAEALLRLSISKAAMAWDKRKKLRKSA